jgi:Flp pilus assembly protein TadG
VVSVEVALTLPVLFLVLFGCVEFARLNMLRNSIEGACYKGARAAAVPGSTATDATETAERELAIVGARSATITVEPSVLTESSTHVSVTIDVPLNDNAWVTPHFLRNKTLSRTCTLTRERVTP